MTELFKILFLFILYFGTSPFSNAQVASSMVSSEMVYKITETPPKPKGGMAAFYDYTQDNMRRPEEAIKKGIRGNVFVRFIIEKDGSLSNVEVIKGIGSGCDEEVVKLLEKAPRWTPGTQNGKIVRVQKTLSIEVR